MRKVVLAIIVICFLSLFSVVVGELVGKFWYKSNVVRGVHNPSRPTILIIGDSQSLIYPKKLRQQLNTHNILNLSESGIGPNIYLAKLNLALRIYKPDQIFIAMYLGNDVLNVSDFVDGSLKESVKHWLAKNSFFYHLIRKAYNNIKYLKYRQKNVEVKKDNRLSQINPLMVKQAKQSPTIVEDNVLIKTKRIQESWNYVDQFLGQMQHLATKKSVPLTLLVIPECVQISGVYNQIYSDVGYHIPEDGLMQDIMQQKVTSIVQKHNIDAIDLLPILKANDTGKLFYLNDPHLSEDGREVVVNTIIQSIK